MSFFFFCRFALFAGFDHMRSHKLIKRSWGIVLTDMTHSNEITRTGTYADESLHAYTYTSICTCTHACIHVYIHLHLHSCMHVCMRLHLHSCIHVYIHLHLHSCMHVCVYASALALMHTAAQAASRKSRIMSPHPEFSMIPHVPIIRTD